MTLKVGFDVFAGASQAGVNDGSPGVIQAEVDQSGAYYISLQRLSDNYYYNATTKTFQASRPSQSNELLIPGSVVVGSSFSGGSYRRLKEKIPKEALSGITSAGVKIFVYPDGGSIDMAAQKVTGVGPFTLTAGMTVVVDVDNVGAATATFDAAAGYVDDTTTYAVADQDGNYIDITIDGGAAQRVTFSGATTTLQSIINQINAALVGGAALDNGSSQLRVRSDKQGTGSSVSIDVGTSDLTFDTPIAGTGDVADISAVTPAEVKTVIEADTTALVQDNGDNTATILSPTTGSSSELDFQASTGLTAIGLSVETINGTDADQAGSLSLGYKPDA
jgi:hypothetical protein